MKIRKKWLRDLASAVFSVYYLFAAEQADEKVRKVQGAVTVDHLRVSWNKATTPYLWALSSLMRPKLTRYPPRAIRIPRPSESSYKDSVSAWLYFDGPLSALTTHNKVIVDIPGGGFVAMSPRDHEDKLLGWAGRTGLPILSLDYKKAPEYPYPYSLNECYDVYHTLIASRGRCVGFAGDSIPQIILTGDSAGGNLATSVVLMILQSAQTAAQRRRGQETLPAPDGLVLIYPGLDMNMTNWMTDEQMSLIQDRRMRKTNSPILRKKSMDYYRLTPETPRPSEDEDEGQLTLHLSPKGAKLVPRGFGYGPLHEGAVPDEELPISSDPPTPTSVAGQTASLVSSKPKTQRTRLAMSSMISYFNDRVLTPEMERAMIILYIGPHNHPDFSTDYLLSPLLAPEELLAKFPKVYFMTGERDPLVDDTVLFAGRLRQAKQNLWVLRKEMGLLPSHEPFDEKDHVEVVLIPGISHGFLQMVGVFPEAWKYIYRIARWFEEIFDVNTNQSSRSKSESEDAHPQKRHHHRHMQTTESSGDEDRPLEMSSSIKDNGSVAGGKGGRGRGGGKKGGLTREENRSSVSLASEDDLLGRRMKGLAGGLMGLANGTRTP